MKRNIKFYLALLVLLISSTGAWAQRIGVSNSMANGSVAVDNANPTGAATVTLTVTPATGYYITASDITVSRTALGAQAPNRAPGIDDTKYAVTAKSVDGTGKGTYTFEVEAGYGAYIEATFTACSAITPTVDITGWTYGSYDATVNSPNVSGNVGNGTVTYDYKLKTAGDGAYASVVPVDAGNYTVRATIAAAGHYLGGVATKDFTIEKKEAALSWSGLSFTYDGSAHVPTATVSNLVGTDECNVTVTGAQTEVGNYTATAETLTGEKAGNYKLPAANTQAFSIVAASMGEITATGYNAVYDGAAHGISVTAPVGATVKYGEAEGTYELNATPTYTNVGTKTVYYQVTKTGFTPVTGSQTVTITAKALTITAKAKAITYGDAPANDGVTYNGFIDTEDESVLGGTLAYSYDYAQYGNVGSYSITPSGLTSTNYAITFVNGTLTVGQKEVGLNWTNTSLTYNGSAQTPTCTATGTVNGDEIGVTVSGAKTEVGDYTATATALTGEKAGNYKLPAANTQAFSITLKQIISPDDPTDPNYGAIVVNVPAEGYTYDGTEKKPTVTVKDGETALTLGTDYTVSYTNNKDAGDNSAIVTITGAGDYSINETRQFSIAKKALIATVKAQNKIYDDNTTATVTATVETGVTGETLTISGLTGTFDNAEVGTGKTVTVNSSAAVVTAGENTKTSNYTITYPATTTANITLKQIISPDDPTDPNYGAIVVNVPADGYTYDGTEKKPTVTVKDGTTVLTLGTDYTVSYTNNKDAGENSAIVTITGAGDYSINETRQFSIAKKALIATVKAQNKIYDDNTTATVTATVETGVTGETLTISGLTGTFDNAEVGTGKTVTVNSSAAVVTAGENTKTSNYTITYPATTTANITLKQIISPDDPTDPNYGAIVVNVPADGYTYDGTEKKPTVTVKDGTTVLTLGTDYTVSYTNNKDAGDNSAIVTITGAGDYSINETRQFSIAKKALTATVKAQNKIYDGNTNATVTATVETGVTGETLTISGLTGTFDNAEVGTGKTVTINSTAAVVTAGDNTKTSNYTITYPATTTANITLKQIISPDDPTDPNYGAIVVNVPTEGYTYDGTEKKPTVTVKDGTTVLTLGTDYTVTYTNNKDAGTATVAIHGAGDYTIEETRKFTIGKAALTIKANDLQREEGEENPELTVTYSGFVNGEDNSVLTTQPTISTTATKESPAGTYPITVSGVEAANYDITYTNGTLTILAKGSTFTMPGGTDGGCGIRVVRNDTGEEVANVVKLTYMNDKTSLRIDNINIATPADASASNPVSVTVYIPATLKNQDNVSLTTYGVGSDILTPNASISVTDIYMPETDAVINVAQHAFRLDATESKTARIHTSLVLLDDYALTAGLKAEYEAAHVMTTIKTTTQYWTLSSGVDLVIPDGMQAHTCQEATNGKVTIKAINSISVATEEGTKTLLKANNGVLMKGTPGSYDLVAWPSVEHASGSTPTEDNAMSYPDNQLIPVIVSKHFDYGKGYYVLKNGEFHAISNDNSKVPACKAVFQLADGQKAPQRMAIDNGTMGISSLTPTLSEGEGVWYTIDGQKLEGKPMTKGIYIINGKKTIIK